MGKDNRETVTEVENGKLGPTRQIELTALCGFSSVQSLERLGRRGDMRNDLAEILFQSFLHEVIVSSSGMGRLAHRVKINIAPDIADTKNASNTAALLICTWRIVG